jgi:pyridoxamine 5'-phosphate oxidase family protein
MTASVFTDAELEFLRATHLGRIATASAKGTPDVSPVTFEIVDGDTAIRISGMDNPRTLKWRNIVATGKAAFVVDDLASVDPWRPRGVKVRGAAEAIEEPGTRGIIVIRPSTVWSWGINEGAETHFAGIIEKRTVG